MWILIWLAISGQNIDHYHIGNYDDKDACIKGKSNASVLVTGPNQSVECLWVNTKKPVDK
jgi:hypothetical protein